MLESHSLGMEIPKLVLEANSRNSPEPLNYTVTLTGLEPPHIVLSSRQQEESIAGKIISRDHNNSTSVLINLPAFTLLSSSLIFSAKPH